MPIFKRRVPDGKYSILAVGFLTCRHFHQWSTVAFGEFGKKLKRTVIKHITDRWWWWSSVVVSMHQFSQSSHSPLSYQTLIAIAITDQTTILHEYVITDLLSPLFFCTEFITAEQQTTFLQIPHWTCAAPHRQWPRPPANGNTKYRNCYVRALWPQT